MSGEPDAAPAAAPRHAVLLALGSRGDVDPLCSFGHALAAAGWRVTVATEARLQPVVASCGLKGFTIASEDVEMLFDPPSLAALQKGNPGLSFLRVSRKWQKEHENREAVMASYIRACADATVVICGPLSACPAFCVAEAKGLPLVIVNLQPMMPTALFPCIMFPPSPLLSRFACYNTATYRILQRTYYADQKRATDSLRVTLGLAPLTRPAGVLDELPRLPNVVILNLFSSLLFPTVCGGVPPADYLPSVMGGFVLPPQLKDPPKLPPGLDEFLDAQPPGGRTVCIGFGSMPFGPGGAALRSLALATARAARCRVVLLTGWTQMGGDNGGGGGGGGGGVSTHAASSKKEQEEEEAEEEGRMMFVCASAPHEALLPRMAAVVHHGGVGTTAACLVAGVPQVPCPVLVDQPHNAARLVEIGVAPVVLPRARLRPRALAAAIVAAWQPRVVAAAATAAAAVRAESAAGLGRAVEAVAAARPPWGARTAGPAPPVGCWAAQHRGGKR